MQSRSCAALWTPPRSINASLVFARQLNRTRDEPGVSRKVWSAIVFGFELEMLRLHLATLADAVDGFLVTEADTCFQTAKSKPLVLTDAISQNALPAAVAAKTFVRVVRYADAEQFLKTRASEFGRSLPPPLIERPGEFPASWFEHLHTCAAGTPRPNCTREARTRWARTVPGLRPRRRGKNVGK